MKKLKVLDWITIICALLILTFGFVRTGSLTFKINAVVIAIAVLSTLITNEKYKLIIALICLSVIAYLFYLD